MSTMSLTASRSSIASFRAPRLARSVHRTVQVSNQITNRHLAQVTDVTMRFALALVPFSALAWMFIAR